METDSTTVKRSQAELPFCVLRQNGLDRERRSCTLTLEDQRCCSRRAQGKTKHKTSKTNFVKPSVNEEKFPEENPSRISLLWTQIFPIGRGGGFKVLQFKTL